MTIGPNSDRLQTRINRTIRIPIERYTIEHALYDSVRNWLVHHSQKQIEREVNDLMIHRLTVNLITHKIECTNKFQVYHTWFDHLLGTFRWTRRWAKMTEIPQTITVRRMCPHIAIPSGNHHINFLITEDLRDDLEIQEIAPECERPDCGSLG